jgi:hypothetical protein
MLDFCILEEFRILEVKKIGAYITPKEINPMSCKTSFARCLTCSNAGKGSTIIQKLVRILIYPFARRNWLLLIQVPGTVVFHAFRTGVHWNVEIRLPAI